MTNKTGITLRLTPGGPGQLGGAPSLYQGAHRDQARRALEQILDALDKIENAQSSLNQVIQDLWQRTGSE